MNLEIYFWVLVFIFFHLPNLHRPTSFEIRSTRVVAHGKPLLQYSGKNHVLRWFFEVFTPYFNKILILTEKWVDFFAKIDLCSKFGYIISKIGESPPKWSSSFPIRDPLFHFFIIVSFFCTEVINYLLFFMNLVDLLFLAQWHWIWIANGLKG